MSKSTRRNALAGLAVAGFAAPAVVAALPVDAGQDAELLTLYREWQEAYVARLRACAASSAAEEKLSAAVGPKPEVAKFRNEYKAPTKGYADYADSAWDALREIASPCAEGHYFPPSAYVEMARRVEQTDWAQMPRPMKTGIVHVRNISPDRENSWLAPYHPGLRARVREILAAYEPWKAEQERVSLALGYETLHRAFVEACEREDAAAMRVMARPAITLAGLRAKGTIAGADYSSKKSAQKEASPDFLTSLVIDLADWEFIAAADAQFCEVRNAEG